MPVYTYEAIPTSNAHKIKAGKITAANKKEAEEKVKALFDYPVRVLVAEKDDWASPTTLQY